MRGAFIALGVLGAIWIGGLFWSLAGGLVLVPRAALVTIGSPGVAGAPGVSAPAKSPESSRPAASKPIAASTKSAESGQLSHGAAAPVSHAAQVATETKSNRLLEPKLVAGVKVFELTATTPTTTR